MSICRHHKRVGTSFIPNKTIKCSVFVLFYICVNWKLDHIFWLYPLLFLSFYHVLCFATSTDIVRYANGSFSICQYLVQFFVDICSVTSQDQKYILNICIREKVYRSVWVNLVLCWMSHLLWLVSGFSVSAGILVKKCQSSGLTPLCPGYASEKLKSPMLLANLINCNNTH